LVDIKLNQLKEELEFLLWVSLSLKITEILNCLSLGLRIRRKLLLHPHFYQIMQLLWEIPQTNVIVIQVHRDGYRARG
jgi:hypothetical protein